MSRIRKISDFILSKLPKRNKVPMSNYEVKYAFTCEGVDYYEFADPMNIPPHRGYHLLKEWGLMKAKITKEYIEKHIEASEAVLSRDHKNVFEAKTEFKRINDQLKERIVYMAFDLESLYRVAAVHFFSKEEHADIYDLEVAMKKISSWKKNANVEDFFLQQPLKKLFTYLEGQDENLKNYVEVERNLNSLHMDNLSAIISGK